jgi:hypothetical protein
MCDLKGILLWVLCCLVPLTVSAGDLDAPAGPSDAGSAMYTLEDIYNRLDAGTPGEKRTGGFTEPTSGPGPMGHTLDEVMGKAPALDDEDGAVAADVLEGKTYWGLKAGEWGPRTGTLSTQTLSEDSTTVAAGNYAATKLDAVDTDLASKNIKKDATIFGVAGDPNVVNTSSGDAVAGDMLSGKKAWVKGGEVTGSLTCPPAPTGNAVAGDVLFDKGFSNSSGTGMTGTMTNVGQETITPTTTNQTITKGYHDGTGYAEGDGTYCRGT